jgi:hypothetical protein
LIIFAFGTWSSALEARVAGISPELVWSAGFGRSLHARRFSCSEGLIFNLAFGKTMATHPKTSTGVGPGGRRERAGRPPGALGKRSRELLAQAKAEGLEFPVDRLLRRMNDPNLPEDYRDSLAGIVAPYCSPRLSAVSITKRPVEMTDEEIARLLDQTREDMRRGTGGRDSWPRRMH